MASRTDSEEVPESREFPASGRQGVEVMDFERAVRAAELAAPPRSFEDLAPKSLPWPAPACAGAARSTSQPGSPGGDSRSLRTP
jgi:hypothetical protein